jgi:hypothetical protein
MTVTCLTACLDVSPLHIGSVPSSSNQVSRSRRKRFLQADEYLDLLLQGTPVLGTD